MNMLLLLFLSYSFGDFVDDISNFWGSLNSTGGPTGFELLQLDMHAKTGGTAGNYWEGGVHSLLTNPSEIAYSSPDLNRRYNFAFTYKTLACDMNANFVGFTAKSGNNNFGFSFLGFFSGDIPLQDNSPGSSIGSYSGENLIFGVTYARSFANFNIGGTLRTLRETIFDVYCSTYSFDVGISRNFKAFKDRSFRIDLSFLHLGPKYGPEYADETFRLPLTWHIGLKGDFKQLFTGLSINKPLNTRLQYTIGAEYRINEYFSFRAGKKYGGRQYSREGILSNTFEKFSFGFGLSKNGIVLDYSYSPTNNELEGSHLFTISLGI
jgi:hypothetical protein